MDKITKDDEGKLLFVIKVKDNHLIMDFGKSLTWIGLHKPEVETLIKILSEKLKEFYT